MPDRALIFLDQNLTLHAHSGRAKLALCSRVSVSRMGDRLLLPTGSAVPQEVAMASGCKHSSYRAWWYETPSQGDSHTFPAFLSCQLALLSSALRFPIRIPPCLDSLPSSSGV